MQSGQPVDKWGIARAVGVVAAAVVAVAALPAASAASDSPVPIVSARTVDTSGVTIVRDVSFPQCGGPLPRLDNGYAAVLGTNNGISFSRNPCLATQLRWAKRLAGPPAFYANTGNPGPRRARRWPVGQSTPKACSADEPDSLGCSYDYGWNAAWASYSAATDAAQRLHRVDRDNARRRAANVDWWLDVETMNSWRTLDDGVTRAAQRADAETIAGEVDALRAAGIESVGIYSTRFQWSRITGGRTVTGDRFDDVAQWLAGYESKADATAGCSDAGFARGPVRMTQYLGSDGFDADVLCAGSYG